MYRLSDIGGFTFEIAFRKDQSSVVKYTLHMPSKIEGEIARLKIGVEKDGYEYGISIRGLEDIRAVIERAEGERYRRGIDISSSYTIAITIFYVAAYTLSLLAKKFGGSNDFLTKLKAFATLHY